MNDLPGCYRWAAAHHGVISRAAALQFISSDLIDRLVKRGEWIRAYQGVYIISPAVCDWRQRLMAVQLWLGPGSAVAGQSAARLHDLEPCRRTSEIEFITDRARSGREGIVLRRSTIRANDIVQIDGFTVADAHRTLIDLGRTLSADDLEVAVEDAFRRRKSSVGHLTLRLKKYGGKGVRGSGPIKQLVDDWGNRPVTQSWLALKIEQGLRGKGMPAPVREFVVNDQRGTFVARVDLAWPDDRVIVDVQSRQYHEQDPDWQADMTRFNRLGSLGWAIFQITHRHWRSERAETFAQIRRAVLGDRTFFAS